jgi:transcriptional regulator with XRE-family HTH domain
VAHKFIGQEPSNVLTTGNQLKAARALIAMDQNDLADRAKVNVNTIRNMEASGSAPIAGRAQNVQAVQAVLERVGVEFLNHGRPGVRLRHERGS